jgi:hypothetical protein
MDGYCEHGNESSGSIKCWEVLEASQEGFSYMSEWYNQAYTGRGDGEQKGQLPKVLGLEGGGKIYSYSIKTL